MFTLHKSIRFAQVLMVATFVIVALLLIFLRPNLSLVGSILLSVAWLIIAELLYLWFSSHQNAKLGKMIDVKCDPASYAAAIQEELNHKVSAKMLPRFYLAQVGAYLHLGDAASAYSRLNQAAGFQYADSAAGAARKVAYDQLLCAYSLLIRDIPGAEAALKSMEQSLNHPKLKKTREQYRSAYTDLQFQINMEKGNFDGAETYYQTQLSFSTVPMTILLTKFLLGVIYLQAGKSGEAKISLDYVIANAGSTRYGPEAQQLIAGWGQKL